MKYAVMSDVHANPAALEAALKDAHVQGCGRFVMLGDTTGYGYDVKEAIKLVKSCAEGQMRIQEDGTSTDIEMFSEFATSGRVLCGGYNGQLLLVFEFSEVGGRD